MILLCMKSELTVAFCFADDFVLFLGLFWFFYSCILSRVIMSTVYGYFFAFVVILEIGVVSLYFISGLVLCYTELEFALLLIRSVKVDSVLEYAIVNTHSPKLQSHRTTPVVSVSCIFLLTPSVVYCRSCLLVHSDRSIYTIPFVRRIYPCGVCVSYCIIGAINVLSNLCFSFIVFVLAFRYGDDVSFEY